MEKIDQNRGENRYERGKAKAVKRADEWVGFIESIGPEAVFNRLGTVYAGFTRDGRLRRYGVGSDIDFKFAAIFSKALKLDLMRTLEIIRRRIDEYRSVKWQRDPNRETYENELAVLTECEQRILKLLQQREADEVVDETRELVGGQVELAAE